MPFYPRAPTAAEAPRLFSMTRLLAVTMALAAASPLPAAAQTDRAGSGRGPVEVGVFTGVGAGPARSGAWGVGATLRVHDHVALEAEYSRYGGVGAACTLLWPDAYRCDVAGWAALGGVAVDAPELGRIRPFVEVLGGRYSRDQEGSEHASAALAVGAGGDVRLGRGFRLRVGARYLRPFDAGYSDLMGEELSYTLLNVGVAYGL